MATTDMKQTEQDLIDDAWTVQDTSNLSGVVYAFDQAVRRLWKIAHERAARGEEDCGTKWINTHTVSRLYARKLADLSGCNCSVPLVRLSKPADESEDVQQTPN